eukprot:7385694-Prymnesium_polylepis.1
MEAAPAVEARGRSALTMQLKRSCAISSSAGAVQLESGRHCAKKPWSEAGQPKRTPDMAFHLA